MYVCILYTENKIENVTINDKMSIWIEANYFLTILKRLKTQVSKNVLIVFILFYFDFI